MPDFATLHVTLCDEHGTCTYPNQAVTLLSEEGARTARTDDAGKVTFAQLMPGKYRVACVVSQKVHGQRTFTLHEPAEHCIRLVLHGIKTGPQVL